MKTTFSTFRVQERMLEDRPPFSQGRITGMGCIPEKTRAPATAGNLAGLSVSRGFPDREWPFSETGNAEGNLSGGGDQEGRKKGSIRAAVPFPVAANAEERPAPHQRGNGWIHALPPLPSRSVPSYFWRLPAHGPCPQSGTGSGCGRCLRFTEGFGSSTGEGAGRGARAATRGCGTSWRGACCGRSGTVRLISAMTSLTRFS